MQPWSAKQQRNPDNLAQEKGLDAVRLLLERLQQRKDEVGDHAPLSRPHNLSSEKFAGLMSAVRPGEVA